ncbi:MAG: hypothetical protein IJL21_00895 [Alphaproteobacteria bacterium]|nr:hypothetical protein [Alphaproteobacteria bacterium]
MKEIDTEQAFKQIKKQNGEAVAKVLRSEVLLDIPNLAHILEFAGNDPEKIKALAPVIREIYKTQNTPEYQTNKTPLELLSQAGYDAFVVTTEKQKNSIKKYYRSGEEICTFRDPHRHENNYMIHAVKRGADKIQPSDHPEREDEYGTSVISIQIAKTGGFISIKNRYNHTVNNPDATFNNNPDNIIHGLSNSLKKYFNVEFNTTENPLPDNYRMVNDQFVYFNHEIENTYFGPDYYFSGSTITKLNTGYEIMLDYFVLDTRTGEVKDVVGVKGSTHKILQGLLKNKKISIRTNPNNKHERMIFADDAHVLSFEKGTITELNLPDIKSIDDSFLAYTQNLRKLYAPKLETVGNEFLSSNKQLTELDLPSLKEVGHNFVSRNAFIRKFNAPLLEKTGSCFLMENQGLTKLELPSLKELADYCLKDNIALSKLYVPKLEIIGPISLMENVMLTELDLPKVREIGGGVLKANKNLAHLHAPKVEKIGDHVMLENLGLIELNLPALQEVGDNFLSENRKLKKFYAPKLKITKWRFLAKNTELTDFVVANDDILHKYNKRLVMILAKNKIKQKLKNGVNGLINMVTAARNTKSEPARI